MAVPYLKYPYPFTSRDEMNYILSSLGVDMRVDDPPVEELAEYYVHYGTGEVLFFISRVAPEQILAAVIWVRMQATIAACFQLTGHSGEPFNATLETQWQQSQERLALVQSKQADIPGFHPVQPRDSCPVIANPRLDMQRYPSQRLIQPASTVIPGSGWVIPNDWPTSWRRW